MYRYDLAQYARNEVNFHLMSRLTLENFWVLGFDWLCFLVNILYMHKPITVIASTSEDAVEVLWKGNNLTSNQSSFEKSYQVGVKRSW